MSTELQEMLAQIVPLHAYDVVATLGIAACIGIAVAAAILLVKTK